jgi:hypothetical protein
MVDSIIGILNPLDSVDAAEMVAPNSPANATPGSRRPNPSEINVVYSIYGIVSEHTPEEWEVIREHQNRDWSISRWFVDDEQKRMKDAGFKLSFRHLDEGAPPPTIPAPSVLPSGPPIQTATPAPAEQPSDYAIPIPDSESLSGLGITDTIIGVFGGTRGDYVDQTFNFLYGVGDNMSLGIGWWLRSTFFDDQADYGGNSYYIGSWVGFVADLAIGGLFKSFGKVFAKELLEQGARNATKGTSRGVLHGDHATMEFVFEWNWRGPKVVSHEWKWSSEALKSNFKSIPEAWKAVRRHEAMHLLDARRHPFAAWYSQRALPGSSTVRYVLEYRGWRAEYLQRGMSPSMIAP